MSSGVRATVAVIVIAFVAIGLYYASLEDGAPSTTPTEAEDLVRADDSTAAGGEPVQPLAATTTIATSPAETMPDNEPIGRTLETFERTPAPSGDPFATVVGRPASGAGAAPVTGATNAASATDLDSATGSPLVQPVANDLEPLDGVATTPEDASPAVDDPTTDEPEVPLSLGIPERGSIMLLVADPFLGEFNREDAVSAFDAVDPAVAPTGTAWVPLAEWVNVPEGEPAPWITATTEEGTWRLVEDTGRNRVELEGMIFTAGERLDTLRGEPIVTFVLKDDGAKAMGALTYPNLGREFALIVDGEVVVVQLIRTAIEARGTLVPTCDRDQAQWIAARLRSEDAIKPERVEAAPAADVADTTQPETAPDAGGTEPAARPAERRPASSRIETWTIAQGDTFSSIAEAWFGDPNKWTLIAQANPNVDPGRLAIGQIITLPPKAAERAVSVGKDGYHVIASGETLSEIAQAYYGKARYWQEIYQANRALIGDDPAELVVGTRLVMPKIDTTP